MSHGTRSAKHGARAKVLAMAAVVLAVVLCVFTLVGPALAEDAENVQADAAATVAEPEAEGAEDAAAASVEEAPAAVAEETAEPVATDEAAGSAAETATEAATEPAATSAKASAFRAASTTAATEYFSTSIKPNLQVAYVNAPNGKAISGYYSLSFVSGPSYPTIISESAPFSVEPDQSPKSISMYTPYITFRQPGTYVYKYYESISGAPQGATSYRDADGILYDLAPRYLTYVVTADENGYLTCILQSVTDAAGNAINPVITNRGTTIEPATITVQPVIQGRDWTDGDSATVTVATASGYGGWNDVVINPSDQLIANPTLVVTNDTAQHAASTTVSLTDAKEGTSYLKISESATPAGTVLDRGWYARIDWKYDDENVLRGTVRYATSNNGGQFAPAMPLQLVNRVTTAPELVEIDVTKELLGRDWTGSDAFAFDIKPYRAPVEDTGASGGSNPSIVVQLPQSYTYPTTTTDTALAPVEEGAGVEVPAGYTGVGRVGYVAPVFDEVTEVVIGEDTPDKTAAFKLGFANYVDGTYVITENADAAEAGMMYAKPVYVWVHWNEDYTYTVYYSDDPMLRDDSWTTEKPVFTNVYEDLNPAPEPEEIVEPEPTPDPEEKPATETTTVTKVVTRTVVKKAATPKTGDAAMFAQVAVAGAALVGAAFAMGRKRG